MKKYYLTIVRKDGTEKEVFVLIPEETAVLLDQCDEAVRLEYLKEEYKAFLRERAETRRHISLEESMENGHDYETKASLPLEALLRKESDALVEKLLSGLTERQRKIVVWHVFHKKSLRKIAKQLKVNYRAVFDSFEAARKKILKNF